MNASAPPKFDHVVVLMFENRSFDNLFGYLYQPGERRSFEGVVGRDLSNPIPAGLDDADRSRVEVHPATRLDTPDPNPGEEYPHVNTQMYGSVEPASNRFASVRDMAPPYNAPEVASTDPTMDGFIADYVSEFREQLGRLPKFSEYSEIMSCCTPEQVPVLS